MENVYFLSTAEYEINEQKSQRAYSIGQQKTSLGYRNYHCKSVQNRKLAGSSFMQPE